MEAPTHLQHKPIIAVNDYGKIDAQFADKTDVVALSIGEAQYDDYNNDNNKEISLKIWRHTGERWSRQSEELPIHRCIDLNILLLSALMSDLEAKYPTSNLPLTVVNTDKLKDISDYYDKKEPFLKPRLMELKNRLTDFLESRNTGKQQINCCVEVKTSVDINLT